MNSLREKVFHVTSTLDGIDEPRGEQNKKMLQSAYDMADSILQDARIIQILTAGLYAKFPQTRETKELFALVFGVEEVSL